MTSIICMDACLAPQTGGSLPHTHPPSSQWMTLLERVSGVALGIFSAVVEPQLFVPFFFVGVVLGCYQSHQQGTPAYPCPPAQSCTQGLLEQATGVKLPPVFNLVVNVAVTVCHVQHHGTVFVPVVALSVGAMAGKYASCGVKMLTQAV